MTPREVQRLARETEGKFCAQLFRSADGTVVRTRKGSAIWSGKTDAWVGRFWK